MISNRNLQRIPHNIVSCFIHIATKLNFIYIHLLLTYTLHFYYTHFTNLNKIQVNYNFYIYYELYTNNFACIDSNTTVQVFNTWVTWRLLRLFLLHNHFICLFSTSLYMHHSSVSNKFFFFKNKLSVIHKLVSFKQTRYCF